MDSIDNYSPTHILRSHKCKVTSLVLNYTGEGNDSQPTLISGDEEGKIVIWNLITRRPVEKFIAGTGSQIIDMHVLNDSIIVLSKDHSLRVYTNLKETFEMKVNTLNFANISIWQSLPVKKEFTMVCCNTTDSEHIDIYNFTDGKMNSLTRLFNSVSFMKFIKKNSLLGDSFTKLGLLMKIVRDNDKGIIFCGFESGVIIGFKICQTNNSKLFKEQNNVPFIEIILLSKFHYPNPILDMNVDETTSILISSSTEKQLGLIDYTHNNIIEHNNYDPEDSFIDNEQHIIMSKELWTKDGQSQTIPTNNGKIAFIRQLKNGDIVYSTWSGKTVVINRTNNDERYSFWVSRSRVTVSASSQGNIDPNRSKLINKDSKYERIGSLIVFDSQRMVRGNEIVKSSKSLAQIRRFNNFTDQSWCFVGYDNGNIAIYKI
ncbi:ASTRA complex subunit [Maudiozyma exigua]|uniref:ASTRA complex subunit n=1 Tax=Maudiozyma exigua TaxID=34358 RepID=A0A9P6WCG6_MAUEX|nr:ASTRA complex subunit [Kazachstania exigua]